MIFITSDGKYSVIQRECDGVHLFYSIVAYNKWNFIGAIDLSNHRVFFSGRYIYIISKESRANLVSILLSEVELIKKVYYASQTLTGLIDIINGKFRSKINHWDLDEYDLTIAINKRDNRLMLNDIAFCDEAFVNNIKGSHADLSKLSNTVPIVDPPEFQCLIIDDICTKWDCYEYKLVPHDMDEIIDYGIFIIPEFSDKKICMFVSI
jgi:hypothetical protein